MLLNYNEEKKCAGCNRVITFDDFRRINPSISLKRALFFWNDSMFLIYCSECYFKVPEKPFKLKKGYFIYHHRMWRNSK